MLRMKGFAGSGHGPAPSLPRLPLARAPATSPSTNQHARPHRYSRLPPLRVIDAGIRPPVQPAPTKSTIATQQQQPHQQQQTHQQEEQQQTHQMHHHQPASSFSAATTNPEETAKLLFDFSSSHIPSLSPSLVLYFPFGVVIAASRMCLWIAGVLMDAPWFRSPTVVSTYLNLLGFKATWRNVNLLPQGRHVMVSNHVTPGDLMVLFQGLPQRYTHLITTAMPPRVTATHNLPCTLKFATPEAIEDLARRASGVQQPGPGDAAEQEEESVHLFPEGGVTNGRWGMMQFTRGFTRLLNPGDWVVPVALKATTPWDIRTHTLLSSFPANLFWLSFCPWVEVEATILEPMQQQPGEAKGVFAKRVQQAIADELGLVVSECNISIKKRVMQKQAKLLGE